MLRAGECPRRLLLVGPKWGFGQTDAKPRRESRADRAGDRARIGHAQLGKARHPLLEAPRAPAIGAVQTRQQLVDARLDQDAAVLQEAAATPHLGAADEFAPMEQDLVGGGAIETDRAVCGGAAR